MPKYSLFRPANTSTDCYLLEALYWRAFGRLPEEYWADEDPWRFSPEIRDTNEAPVPGGPELTEDECRYAGIPIDPRTVALLDDTETLEPNYYKDLLNKAQSSNPRDLEKEKHLKKAVEDSTNFHEAFARWVPLFDEYIDQFKIEICGDLRRGLLTAHATELPAPTNKKSLSIMLDQNQMLEDLDVVKIPQECWISSHIDWGASSIYGRERSFIWIHLAVDKILERYPPGVLVDTAKAFPIGSSVAIVDTPTREIAAANTRRGRPSYPWGKFHVEVAKLYKDGDMPEKKEAAIAVLQDRFLPHAGKRVSRAAIGQKLKPYFDVLKNEDEDQDKN